MDGNLPRGAHTDKSNGRPIFKDLDWFVYKVSYVMYSTSVCEHYWSIEGWIHSKRRNRLSQELVERLLRAHTNLVFRQSSGCHPWSSITVGHRVCYGWTRTGTRSLWESLLNPLCHKLLLGPINTQNTVNTQSPGIHKERERDRERERQTHTHTQRLKKRERGRETDSVLRLWWFHLPQ